MYKIYLKWSDPLKEDHFEEMDYAFKDASPKTYQELVEQCEKCVDDLIKQYGYKEWIENLVPYKKIVLFNNNSQVDFWSVGKYIREKKKGGKI